LQHWICCLMLSRLNSEHNGACSKLLKIRNSLLSQRIDHFLHLWVNLTTRIQTTISSSTLGTFAKRLTQDEESCELQLKM